MWDADTGQMVGQPLQGHTGAVLSVSYSHDGTRIVSGSEDRTIRMWDADTGQMVGQPLQGHTGYVYSVSYSHDGTHVVSGSWDRTIRMWNADTGRLVGQPLRGHTDAVWSVAYSYDSTHIVSGSADNVIRIWDAHSAQTLDGTLDFHSISTKATNQIAHLGQLASDALLPISLAPSNHPTVSSHADWTLDDTGWLLDNSQKLMWVSPELHSCLLRPRNIAVISARGWLGLDLSNAQFGENWHKCYCVELDQPIQ